MGRIGLIPAYALGLLLAFAGGALAVSNGSSGEGLGYSCSKEPGKTGVCSCSGVVDCDRMTNSGVCGSSAVLTCDDSGCTCDWVPKPAPTVVHKPIKTPLPTHTLGKKP